MTNPKPTPDQRRNTRQQEKFDAEQKRRQNVRRKRLVMMVSSVLVLVVAGLTTFFIVNNNDKSSAPPPLAAVTADFQGIPSQRMTLGDPNAPVTFVEYADYQCPYCKQFTLETAPKLIEDFVKTGKVKYVFRPMPIVSPLPLDNKGNESVRAAEAAMCAMDQGKFWDFHHLLFEKQNGENIGIFSDANLINYATDAGLDVTTFSTCLSSNTHQKEVLASRAQGIKDGVTGTPSFFIDGTKVSLTTQGYDKLKQQLQAAVDGQPIP